MGETAEYQRLQETSESDYQRLPSDDEEVDYSFLHYSSGHATELQTNNEQQFQKVLSFLLKENERV